MAAYRITGEYKWLELYEKLAEEKPDGILTRADICRYGLAPDMVKNNGLIQFWIHACAHLFLEKLADYDEKRRTVYKQALENNGAAAVKFLDGYKKYLASERLDFDTDWTKLSHLYKRTENPTDGMNIALEQNRFWMSKIVPERHIEHNVLGNMLFASVICLTSGNKDISETAKITVYSATDEINWEKLNLSYAFVAESAIYYSLRKDK
jgi:hypothetical protein